MGHKSCMLAAALALSTAMPAFGAEGQVDTSYVGNGRARVAFDRGDTAATKADRLLDIRLQPDGKLLLFGSVNTSSNQILFGVARLTANGSLDNSFSGDGKADFGSFASVEPRAFALMPDGHITVVAQLGQTAVLFRLAGNGEPDPFPNSTFNTLAVSMPGVASVDFADLHALPDGRLLAAGTVTRSGVAGEDFVLARFTANGLLDPTFGSNSGYTRVDFAMDNASVDRARALAVSPDGRVAVLGDVSAIDREIGVAMFDGNGQPLAGFDGDGRRIVDFDIGNVSDDRAADACFLPDGRLLTAATVQVDGIGDSVGLAAIAANGTLDGGFATQGRRVSSLFGATRVHRVACLAGDRVLFTGSLQVADPALGPSEAYVTRISGIDGQSDSSFANVFGSSVFGLNAPMAPAGREDAGVALAPLSDGRVLVGVDNQYDGADYDFVAVRLQGAQLFADGFE